MPPSINHLPRRKTRGAAGNAAIEAISDSLRSSLDSCVVTLSACRNGHSLVTAICSFPDSIG